MMKLVSLISLLFLLSCNSENHFEAVTQEPAVSTPAPVADVISGDIIVVSGGTVAATVTPFPLHKVALFSSSGDFKRFLYEGKAGELLWGGAIDSITGDFLFTLDNIDRVDRVDLDSLQIFSSLLDRSKILRSA